MPTPTAATPARPCDLEHHHRQRDRDAQPAPQDLVEERVGRIVVARDVAAEPLDHEELVADRVEARLLAHPREVVETTGPEAQIETGMHVLRDEEGGLVERRFDGAVADERRESSRRVHRATV